MIDVLVIAPGNAKAIYQDLSSEYSAIEPPLWAGMLTKALQKKGKVALCLDGQLYSPDSIINEIYTCNPKLIAMVVYGQQPSASTQNMFAAKELCLFIKEIYPELPIMMIGGYVSALPEETKRDIKCDFAVKGEGLLSILNFLDGTSYLETMAKNLDDTYPGIQWDHLPMSKYRAHDWHCFGRLEERNSYASIYTSLGCPFKCSFCCINSPFDSNTFRYWSPKFTANEIGKLVEDHDIKNLKIADEMFVLREDHYLDLCKILAEMKLDLNIWAYSRIDTIKEKNLETLKKAGINWLALGIESGSKHVRDGVIKGRFGFEEIVKNVETIKKAGINVIGNYIFGLPDDTEETMKETYDLAVELNCEFANFYSAMAYPGSKLYVETRREDLPETYLGYSQHSYECTPLPTKAVSAKGVLESRDKYFHAYFERPEYLSMLERKFGKDTRQHVERMARIKLKRKLTAGRTEISETPPSQI